MPESQAVEVRADDVAACADAHTDGLAVVRFYSTLIAGELPEELAGELTGTWLESYLDTSTVEVD